MFGPLHALAKKATLLIVITDEDGLLRVSVTPTMGAKPHTLRPLSLLGTPDELDEGFGEALAEWQAPRRPLIEQARDDAGDEAPTVKPGAPKALPAPAAKPPKAKSSTKAAAKGEDKPSISTAIAPDGTQPDAAPSTTDSPPLDAGTSPAPVVAPAQVESTSTVTAAGDDPKDQTLDDGLPSPEAPAVDVFTLDLF